ncbi:similar to RIKEN cDNA A930016P21 (predicted), isoform CRA_c [Rattus norvegicus]|uniref:Similar to RIKEN cDNA A930016P21 (Predicted), isoform CRA_c n=1 Tax=Rattus norvegicus TaxID=10116 RepID=A6JN02_RAT|nr:similar to RIKEN cDNA A930016P21 (predicted), isoform CRA_c [Rattus norvegicus]
MERGEDPRLVPITHVRKPQPPETPAPENLILSSGLFGKTDRQTDTHRHTDTQSMNQCQKSC